jgi:hypothetical protein
MCFSATANFVASAGLASVGVITLTRVAHVREVAFASLPLLFALHQFVEGFVWLGLNGTISSSAMHLAGGIYMFYAQGILPILVPLSVYWIEPSAKRRRLVVPFVALGVVLGIYILWSLIRFPTHIAEEAHSVVYSNPGTHHELIAVLYVIATCGALFFSGYRYIVGLAVVNLLGILVVIAFKEYAFTSVWCAYAAMVSILIYGHLHRRRLAEQRGAVLRS